MVPLPVGEAGQLLGVDDAVTGINAGEVDLANELNGRGFVGIVRPAVHPYRVDAILVYAVRRSEDCAIPVGHEEVLWIFETIRTSFCPKTLLALLKFLEKPKIPGNFGCGHLASFLKGG